MQLLSQPDVSARDSFSTSISRIRDVDLRRRLEAITEAIEQESEEFAHRSAIGDLHRVKPSEYVGDVSAKELATVYTSRFARRGSPGRPIYDSLMLAPGNERCPLCGHRLVSSLDHHLPKAHYPALAVVPLNLVPACADCNKKKLDRRLVGNEDQTLHPYFDDSDTDEWLKALVVESQPPVVAFRAEPSTACDADLAARIVKHFEVFELSRLYTTQAAVELEEMRQYLSRLFLDTGRAGLHTHLTQTYSSCRSASVNSWRTAMYAALSRSGWFLEGNALSLKTPA